MTPFWRRPPFLLAALALAVRAAVALATPVIAADAGYYLRTAEILGEGRFDEGLSFRNLHPLFPLLTAALAKVLGSLEASAYLLSVLGSSGAAVPLYFLVRAYWNARVAAWTVFVYALHPILTLESAEALPTGFYLGLFVTAVSAGLLALRGGPWILYPAAGLAAGLAYLTRTEGILAIGFLLAGTMATLVRLAREKAGRPRWLAFGAGTLAAAALFNAAALPYIAYVSRKSGRFTITQKAGTVLVEEATGREDRPTSKPRERPYFYTILKTLSQALFWPTIPFGLLGLAATRRMEGRWRALLPLMLMAVVALAPAALLFAVNRYYRPSHRYMLAGTVLLLPWIAAGTLALVDALRSWVERRRWPVWLGFAPAVFLLVASAVKAAPPRRGDETTFLDAGAWISAQPLATRLILTTEPKIAWYGRCEDAVFRDWVATPGEAFRRTHSSLVVVDDASLRHYDGPAFLERLDQEGFVRMERFERKDGRTVWIFRPP